MITREYLNKSTHPSGSGQHMATTTPLRDYRILRLHVNDLKKESLETWRVDVKGFQMHACAPTPAMTSTWRGLLLSPPPLTTRCVLHVQPSLSSIPFHTQCILPSSAATFIFPWFYNHWNVNQKFIMFIPRNVHKQFATLNQYTILFLRYLYYITQNIATCFGPRGFFIREPNQSNTA